MKKIVRAVLPLFLLVALLVGVSTMPGASLAEVDACKGCCDWPINGDPLNPGGCNYWAGQFNMVCAPGHMNYLDCKFIQIEEDYCLAQCYYSEFHCEPWQILISCLIVEEEQW